MTLLPVAQLVRKNRNDLLRLALLNQRVVNDNVLLPRQTKEVRVAVRAALAPVNHVQLMQRELQALGQRLDAVLELPLLQRRQLVEQRENGDRVDCNHEDLETGGEGPEVEEELVTGALDDGEETGQDGRREDEREQVGLDHIGDEELGRLLVESEPFFQDECMVDGRREREGLVEKHESEDKDDRLRDFSLEPGGREPREQTAGPVPDLGEYVEVDEGNILDLAPQAVDKGEAGLCAAVGLGLVVDFLGDFLLEDGGDLGALEDAVLAEGEERLKEPVADGETDDELLPGEERAVEGPREALRQLLARLVARGGSSGRRRFAEKAGFGEWQKGFAYLEEIHGS